MSWIFLILLNVSLLQGQIIDDMAIEQAWHFAETQLSETIRIMRHDSTRHPKVTNNIGQDGNGDWTMTGRGGWTSGFFSGCLWKMAAYSGDSTWLDYARRWTGDLERQKYNDGDHDIGFRMYCSYGQGLLLQPDTSYEGILHTSAHTLSTRFDSTIGCIKSWDWKGNYAAIIDNMMNLELLFWSAQNSGNPEFYDMAVSHADKTRENHVYIDGSTWHVVDYNDDGSVREKSTQQGYSDASCWSRGQAWGIYGFTLTYRETGEQRFLETAELLADYFIEHLPADWVPYSDFNAPNIPNCEKDASAAAITCAALFELDQYSENDYYTPAVNMLKSLIQNYLAEGTGYASILHRASQWYTDQERGAIYADYYFLEALQRFSNIESSVGYDPSTPEQFGLSQNYPNPFNGSTTFNFELPHAADVKLSIYDITGRHVATLVNGFESAGQHRIHWTADQHCSGTYFIQLKAENNLWKKNCTLVK